MGNFREIKEKINKLQPKEVENLLKDIYHFSNDMRLFLENRFFDHSDSDQDFIKKMERETIDKVYKRPPQIPNGKTVNSIISKAKKSKVDAWVIMELEKLAYKGFIEFLNEYGGEPDSLYNIACRHLEVYLKLVKTEVKGTFEKNILHQEVKDYLLDKNNMLTDYLDETYEDITGIPMKR